MSVNGAIYIGTVEGIRLRRTRRDVDVPGMGRGSVPAVEF
jgi:hypothetical protein